MASKVEYKDAFEQVLVYLVNHNKQVKSEKNIADELQVCRAEKRDQSCYKTANTDAKFNKIARNIAKDIIVKLFEKRVEVEEIEADIGDEFDLDIDLTGLLYGAPESFMFLPKASEYYVADEPSVEGNVFTQKEKIYQIEYLDKILKSDLKKAEQEAQKEFKRTTKDKEGKARVDYRKHYDSRCHSIVNDPRWVLTSDVRDKLLTRCKDKESIRQDQYLVFEKDLKSKSVRVDSSKMGVVALIHDLQSGRVLFANLGSKSKDKKYVDVDGTKECSIAHVGMKGGKKFIPEYSELKLLKGSKKNLTPSCALLNYTKPQYVKFFKEEYFPESENKNIEILILQKSSLDAEAVKQIESLCHKYFKDSVVRVRVLDKQGKSFYVVFNARAGTLSIPDKKVETQTYSDKEALLNELKKVIIPNEEDSANINDDFNE